MPSYTLSLSLAHNPTGAGLACVEHRRRPVGVAGSERVRHVHLLEVFRPNASYESLRERLGDLLNSTSLKDNTRVIVACTEAQLVAAWRALSPVAGVYASVVAYDAARLRAALARLQAELQAGRVGFGAGLGLRERLQEELLALSPHNLLEAGVLPGPLSLCVLAACGWPGGGSERPLPDDPARDKIVPLDLRPAPAETPVISGVFVR